MTRMFSPNPGHKKLPCSSGRIRDHFLKRQNGSVLSYLFIFAEPVDVEDGWHVAARLLHVQPMLNVIPSIVTEERSGGKRIVHNLSGRVLGSRRRLGADWSADKDSMAPVERFVDQRHSGGPPSAKNDGRDGHAFRILPFRIDNGALTCWNAKPKLEVIFVVFISLILEI